MGENANYAQLFPLSQVQKGHLNLFFPKKLLLLLISYYKRNIGGCLLKISTLCQYNLYIYIYIYKECIKQVLASIFAFVLMLLSPVHC